MPDKRMVTNHERHRLILVVPQSRHAHDNATVGDVRLSCNYPEMGRYIGAWRRNQQSVAASHPCAASRASHERLRDSETLNLALDECDVCFSPIFCEQNTAVCNRN